MAKIKSLEITVKTVDGGRVANVTQFVNFVWNARYPLLPDRYRRHSDGPLQTGKTQRVLQRRHHAGHRGVRHQ